MEDQENAAQDEASVLLDFPDFPDAKIASLERTLIEVGDWCHITCGSCPMSDRRHPKIQTLNLRILCTSASCMGRQSTQIGTVRKRIGKPPSVEFYLYLGGTFCFLRCGTQSRACWLTSLKGRAELYELRK
jgi:hypothetical protein